MKIGVWGLGEVGTGIACRLATTPFTSELVLINRTHTKATARAIDITHGLAFSPACRSVRAVTVDNARARLADVDLVVVTAGVGVREGGTRADVYPDNRVVFDEHIVPALRDYRGLVLVVSNPVDLMTRHLVVAAGLTESRVLGLGTVVETARLRAALAANAVPARPPHDVVGFVIGTHDANCVTLPDAYTTVGVQCTEEALDVARGEIVVAAGRVKKVGSEGGGKMATLHPIVEGVVAVVAAVAADAHRTMTVSSVDVADRDRLAYSIPCVVGRDGIVERHEDVTRRGRVASELAECLNKLRATLSSGG